MADEVYDCIVIGAGPAGLSAALNLARARRRIVVVDSNRPRNAATLVSHGFITRDGISPHDLRKLATAELGRYPEVSFYQGRVVSLVRAAEQFVVEACRVNASPDRTVTAASVLVATGLRETLPALPSIRSFYGMGLFSCIECDGYEQSDKPLALIGETNDLASRALLIAQWSRDLTVFTNGVGEITSAQEDLLATRGVKIERRKIADVAGHRGVVSAIALEDGDSIPVEGGFVRPRWETAVDFADSLGLATGTWGLLMTDADGRTNVTGVYAAGDSTTPGPQQLIVAAGAGARAAATINRDMIGIPRR